MREAEGFCLPDVPQILFNEEALSTRHKILINPQLAAEVLKRAGVDQSQIKKIKIIIANRETDEDHQGHYAAYYHNYWNGVIVLYPGEMEKIAFHRKVSSEWLGWRMNQALVHESKHAGDSTFGKSILIEMLCSLSEKLKEFRARRFAESFRIDPKNLPIRVKSKA